jgi:hypothetical protein
MNEIYKEEVKDLDDYGPIIKKSPIIIKKTCNVE